MATAKARILLLLSDSGSVIQQVPQIPNVDGPRHTRTLSFRRQRDWLKVSISFEWQRTIGPVEYA
jgi:hypothetical protein